MSQPVFAYIIHKEGVVDDTALELISAAKGIDPNASPIAIALGSGTDLEKICIDIASSFSEVWKIDDPAFSYINAEPARKILSRILPKESVVLMPHEHFGMDLGPGLSVCLNAAYLPDAIAFQGVDNNTLTSIREEYSGMVSTHVTCDISGGAVITIRPGSFQADEKKDKTGQVVDKTKEAIGEGIPDSGRIFLEILEAEAGDVDITKSEVLVSVGRGIEEEDNLDIIHELAEAMGADVSCSRPIVDAKWLEKSRQVGTSGQTVKPKIYMALGISGSFQHLGGLKGAPYVVAINKNAKAPIFQVADVGIVTDLLDFIPDLTEKIEELKR
jgi:electron transfer flavoprotein alpha subunit